MIHRRAFLTAAASGATAAASGPTDPPVRRKPLEAKHWGTQFYGEEERRELIEVVETGQPFRWYGMGDKPPMKVLTFEKEFAARMQTRYALGVTSGTAALQCAMAALGIGPGDEVILPAWTWYSCAHAVILAGALPVFAEIDESFNIDPNDIERRITPDTRAIMAVHLQGNPCDLDRVLAIAKKHKIRVIEDCAQSVGASYKGKPLGSWGDIAIYSLQLTKTITSGEGGAVATSDARLFERAARFHDMGGLRGPHQELMGGKAEAGWFVGANYRMNEFTGGVLLAQLRKLDTVVTSVRANARRVYDGIAGLPGLRLRKRPDPEGEIGTGVFLEFPSGQLRDGFMAAMKRMNVPAQAPGGSKILPVEPHIEKKITAHPGWPSFQTPRGRAIQYGAASCPRTIDILNRFAGVLMDPKYTRQDTADAVSAIRASYREIGLG